MTEQPTSNHGQEEPANSKTHQKEDAGSQQERVQKTEAELGQELHQLIDDLQERLFRLIDFSEDKLKSEAAKMEGSDEPTQAQIDKLNSVVDQFCTKTLPVRRNQVTNLVRPIHDKLSRIAAEPEGVKNLLIRVELKGEVQLSLRQFDQLYIDLLSDFDTLRQRLIDLTTMRDEMTKEMKSDMNKQQVQPEKRDKINLDQKTRSEEIIKALYKLLDAIDAIKESREKIEKASNSTGEMSVEFQQKLTDLMEAQLQNFSN